jgi:hypothetical protein
MTPGVHYRMSRLGCAGGAFKTAGSRPEGERAIRDRKRMTGR